MAADLRLRRPTMVYGAYTKTVDTPGVPAIGDGSCCAPQLEGFAAKLSARTGFGSLRSSYQLV